MSSSSKHIPHDKKAMESTQAYACDFCTERFKYKLVLEKHKMTKCHEARQSFSCNTCNKSFSRLSDLSRHKKTHQTWNEVLLKKLDSKNGRKAFEKEKTHKTWNETLLEKLDSKYNKKTIEKEKRKIHETWNEVHLKKIDSAIQFSCHFCEASFKFKIDLYTHKLNCNLCQKSAPKYICDGCHKCFKYKLVLDNHYLTCNILQFSCNICKASFKFKIDLYTHQLTCIPCDKSAPKYICDGCHKCFKYKLVLDNHKLTCNKLQYYDFVRREKSHDNIEQKVGDCENINIQDFKVKTESVQNLDPLSTKEKQDIDFTFMDNIKLSIEVKQEIDPLSIEVKQEIDPLSNEVKQEIETLSIFDNEGKQELDLSKDKTELKQEIKVEEEFDPLALDVVKVKEEFEEMYEG